MIGVWIIFPDCYAFISLLEFWEWNGLHLSILTAKVLLDFIPYDWRVVLSETLHLLHIIMASCVTYGKWKYVNSGIFVYFWTLFSQQG